jgi:16S rRNA (guanine527-N7)-methyltransferase
LTGLVDPADVRRVHLDAPLAAADLVVRGPIIDVGSGGGSPGLPLAAARPRLAFHLLDSNRKKCAFLRRYAAEFPNVSVVCARAEEHGAGRGRDAYALALARALAPPAVALEWCLPLVAPGGAVILYTGDPEVERATLVARALGGGDPEVISVSGSDRRRLLVVPKLEATPARFPRRPGLARKRPLA